MAEVGQTMLHGYIDCHAHLSASEFEKDIETVVDTAKDVGVRAILAVTECRNEFEKVLALSERFPTIVAPCIGVHPVQVENNEMRRPANLKDLEGMEDFVNKHKDRIFAIGEVGLDFSPTYFDSNNRDSQKQEQCAVFAKQIEIAKEHGLPLNVHSRSAGRPTINFLKEHGATKVLLHAFDGKPSVALQGVGVGYYFSIPPSIVRSEQKQKLVKALPLSNLILETDSPALGTEKQVRNEPQYIKASCEMIARIKELPIEQVMIQTTCNALKLFPKLKQFLKA